MNSTVFVYWCFSLLVVASLFCGVVLSKTTREPTIFEKSITKNVIFGGKTFTLMCYPNLQTTVPRSFDGNAISGKKISEYSENFSTKLNGTTFKGGVFSCRPIAENEVDKDQYQDKPREIWKKAPLGSATVLEGYFYAYPTPEIKLSKSASQLSNDSNYEIQMFSLGENLYYIKLLIKNVEKTLLGNYDFHAKNQFGIDKSSVILIVPDQDQHPTQGIDFTAKILISLIGVIAAFISAVFVIFCFKKKLCFALPCFSNRLHGTQGRPDNKEVLGEDGKDERAGSDGTHRKDDSTNGRPDSEGPPGTAELNGVEGQDRQPEASKVLGTAWQDVGGVTQRHEAPNVTNQFCRIQMVNRTTDEGALLGQDQEEQMKINQ